jgi:ATP-binding cassette subfamily C protein CydD
MRPLDPRLLRRAHAAQLLIGIDSILGTAMAVAVILQAALIARTVARGFSGASLADLSPDLVALLLVFLVRGALGWGFEVAGVRAASAVLSELRLELAERRLRDDPLALDGTEAAEVTTAAVQGVDALQAYFARYLPQLVLACIVPVLVLAFVAVVDVGTALIMLITLPLVPVFMWLIGRYTEERTRERWLALRLLSSHFLDVVRGLPTLRAFNRARAQVSAIREVSERYRRATMGTLRVGFLSGSVLELAATLSVALVAVTVGVRLVHRGIGLEAGLTALLLAPELYSPLRQLGVQFHASADGLAVAERMLQLLEAPATVSAAARRDPPSPVEVPLTFERVSFMYPNRPRHVLHGVDIRLPPSETIALVGESGSGKSTVATLLLRLADPSSGRIVVGDVDLAECDGEKWRQFLAWVPQRPTIFRGTVAENIRLGKSGASEDEIDDAAALAGVDRFVLGFRDGYETIVGDGGRSLSTGERRRIALARAFVRGAPLLVLDEPTADLDSESARIVREGIERFRVGRTVLLIAHRSELVALADRVVVLEDGRVRSVPGSQAA